MSANPEAAPAKAVAALPESVIDCSKVGVRESALEGAGAFAAVDIRNGDLVERGIVRRLTNCDGNENPYVFTWSVDRTVWACGSGCSTFYNTGEASNTHMTRFYDENRYEIHATRDIAAGEELTHVYSSKQWRKCFADLRSDN
jgi:hypothetical protein